MVNHNKRGLSAIVATLIVVLLAIVAFGIISGFIQDVVTQRTSEADLASSDTRLNVQKASVEGNMSSVSVRRQGSDSLEVVGARAVFDSGDGRAVASSNFTIGKQELDTFSIPLCSEEFSDVDFSSEDLSATVYPIVMYEGERTMLDGNPSSVDFVEVDGPELVENCNKSQSSESDSESGTVDSGGDGSGDGSSDSGTGSDDSGSTGDGSGSEDGGGSCVDKDDDNDPSVYENCGQEADVPEDSSDDGGSNVGSDQGFEVSTDRVRAIFNSPDAEDKMKSFVIMGSSAETEIQTQVQGEISDYVNIDELIVLESEEKEVYFTVQNPGRTGDNPQGTLTLSSQNSEKEIALSIMVY